MTLADTARKLKSRSLRRVGTDRPRSASRARLAACPVAVLMTDQRLDDPLAVVSHLPPGTLVIVRAHTAADRCRLARLLLPTIRRRRLRMAISSDWRLAATLGVGLHLPETLARHGDAGGCLAPLLGYWRHRGRRRHALLSIACHSPRALRRADDLGADMAFLSPVFATRSHQGVCGLGTVRAARMIRGVSCPVLALGGVTSRRAEYLASMGFHGFAAVGGWMEHR